jgi:acyl-CoA thioesterase FadM
MGNKTIRYGYRFYNGKREVVATYEALAVVLDLEKRRAAPVPDFMRENAKKIWLGTWPPEA